MSKMEDEYPPFNAYLHKPVEITEGITVNTVFFHGWANAQTVLVIDEGTTIEKIKDHWSKIKEYRDVLTSTLGDPLERNYDLNVYKYKLLKDRGYTFTQISNLLNYYLIIYLIETFSERKDEQPGSAGELFIFSLFNAFRISITVSEFDELYETWVEELKNGKAPWKLDFGPFGRDKVREVIRNFNEKIERGTIKIGSLTNSGLEKAKFSEIIYFLEGYYDRANELIKNTYPDNWEKHKDFIMGIMENIEEEIETTDNPLLKEVIESLGKKR